MVAIVMDVVVMEVVVPVCVAQAVVLATVERVCGSACCEVGF